MGWEPEPEFTGVPVGAADPERALYGITYQDTVTLQSVTQNNRKLIYNWTGALELYDLAEDPEELNELSRVRPSETMALWRSLKPYTNRLHEEFYPDGPSPHAPSDPKVPEETTASD